MAAALAFIALNVSICRSVVRDLSRPTRHPLFAPAACVANLVARAALRTLKQGPIDVAGKATASAVPLAVSAVAASVTTVAGGAFVPFDLSYFIEFARQPRCGSAECCSSSNIRNVDNNMSHCELVGCLYI